MTVYNYTCIFHDGYEKDAEKFGKKITEMETQGWQMVTILDSNLGGKIQWSCWLRKPR